MAKYAKTIMIMANGMIGQQTSSLRSQLAF